MYSLVCECRAKGLGQLNHAQRVDNRGALWHHGTHKLKLQVISVEFLRVGGAERYT